MVKCLAYSMNPYNILKILLLSSFKKTSNTYFGNTTLHMDKTGKFGLIGVDMCTPIALVHSCCYNKILQIGQLINNSYLFLTILEARVQDEGTVLFLVHSWPVLVVYLYVRRGEGVLWNSLIRALNLIEQINSQGCQTNLPLFIRYLMI